MYAIWSLSICSFWIDKLLMGLMRILVEFLIITFLRQDELARFRNGNLNLR